jgi:hypothetical protein
MSLFYFIFCHLFIYLEEFSILQTNFAAAQFENVAYCQEIDDLEEGYSLLLSDYIFALNMNIMESVDQRQEIASTWSLLSSARFPTQARNCFLEYILSEIAECDRQREERLSEKVAALKKALPEGRDNLTTIHGASTHSRNGSGNEVAAVQNLEDVADGVSAEGGTEADDAAEGTGQAEPNPEGIADSNAEDGDMDAQ